MCSAPVRFCTEWQEDLMLIAVQQEQHPFDRLAQLHSAASLSTLCTLWALEKVCTCKHVHHRAEARRRR